MDFSSKSEVTRYGKTELMALKSAKSSRSPPCQYLPQIIRLNILKTELEDYEIEMKPFGDLMSNLAGNNWDPKLMEMLNTYHRSLLYPNFNAMGKRNIKQ